MPALAQTPSQAVRRQLIAEFGQRRDIGKALEALRACGRQHLQFAALIERSDGDWRTDLKMDTSGQHFLRDLVGALERHLGHPDADGLFQFVRDQFLRRAGADGAIENVAGMRLGVTHKLLERIDRNRFGERHQVVIFRHQRDRCNVGELVGHVFVQQRVDRVEIGAKRQAVTVRRLRQHVVERDHAAGAGLVLDIDFLTELRAEAIGDKTRRNVGRSAGKKADDEFDRAGRIGLGCRGAGHAAERPSRQRCRRAA